jgi:hypothetical protein
MYIKIYICIYIYIYTYTYQIMPGSFTSSYNVLKGNLDDDDDVYLIKMTT